MTVDAVTLVAVFISVALLTGAIASATLRQYAPERKRLREITRLPWIDAAGKPLTLAAAPNVLAERICRVMPRSEKRMTEMRQKLVSAGYRSPAAPAVYAASQIVSAVVVSIVGLLITWQTSTALLGLVTGFVLPSLWLKAKVSRRKRIIRDGLADILDLLVVCLESGSGVDQAILRCGEELAIAYKPLADELTLVANEIRAGTPRPDALLHLADRTAVADVRSLVTMLIQTDRYGTSIAQALRVHADLLRTRRRQRAEERAGKANVKLTIPLVLCLFPAFYILTLGPSLLEFYRIFASVVADTK